MQEAIELLLNYARGVWLKRWILVLVAWIVCLLGWSFVLKMPNQYQSAAKVYVDTQSLLGPLLRGLTIQTNPEQQVELMVKTLFTRPNLEKIARLADLDIQANTDEEFNNVISELRSGIKLNRAGRDNIYTINFTAISAQRSYDIVQATLTSLVENTLGDKRQDTDTASDFIDRQIAEYEDRLSKRDHELKEFKKRYYDLMGSGGDYYGRMEQLKQSIKSVELELREAQARRRSIDRQLEGELPTFGLMEESRVTQQYNMTTSYDARISSLENTLDQLRLRYTDAHPDIKETERVLADLISRRDAEIEERISALGTHDQSQRRSIDENPVYQQLKLALSREDTQVQSLSVRLAAQQKQLKDLQKKINTIPEIEAELKELERGYGVTQQKYTELLSRRESARLSQQADVSADSFQFRVIDPPRVPNKPSGPNRPILLTGVTIGGLGMGFGLAFLMSQLRPAFFSARQLSTITGRPVLGSVSIVPLPQNLTKRKRKHRYTLLTLILLAIYAGLMIVQLFPQINNALITAIPDIPSIADTLIPKIKALINKLLSFL